MRRIVALLLVMTITISFSAMAESGINEEPNLSGTDLESVFFPNEASAGDEFGISVKLNEDPASNVTSANWITQICINSGVCYPPETYSLTDTGNGFWDGSIVPEEDLSYINWRIELHYENGNESSVPAEGFGWRVWSDCWYDNGTWGGPSTDCQDRDRVLPGFSLYTVSASIGMAALMARRS